MRLGLSMTVQNVVLRAKAHQETEGGKGHKQQARAYAADEGEEEAQYGNTNWRKR